MNEPVYKNKNLKIITNGDNDNYDDDGDDDEVEVVYRCHSSRNLWNFVSLWVNISVGLCH